jgi:hypothetical protein
VYKFHPIWCPITQVSSLGRNEHFLGENHVFRDLLPDNVCLYWTMSEIPEQCSKFLDNAQMTVSDRHPFTVLAVFY